MAGLVWIATSMSGCGEYALYWFGRAREECNGLDDDNNDRVDDGLEGCLACDVAPQGPLSMSIQSTCLASTTRPRDPWAVTELWRGESDCRVTSVFDLDGDGVAEILCVGSQLLVLDGMTGAREWTSHRAAAGRPTAVADTDGDGNPEIFVIDRDGYVASLAWNGDLLWRTDAPESSSFQDNVISGLVVADVDGDGAAEIITDYGILDAGTGAVEAELWDRAIGVGVRDVVVADLDTDGDLDVLFDLWNYEPSTGKPRWDVDADEPGHSVPVVLQADDDDHGEVAWFLDSTLLLVDDDGTVLSEVNSLDDGGQPCAGDLDGDGLMELALVGVDSVRAWRGDGRVMWSSSLEYDPSGGTMGCTTFDFDADGARELIIATATDVEILDGASGATRWSRARPSLTVLDLPLVVDVDGDGSPEIVVSGDDLSNDDEDWPGVVVYTNPNHDWPSGSTFWPYESWSGSGEFPDGTIDPHPEPPWLKDRIWRGQPSYVAHGTDLRVEVVDDCEAPSPSPSAEVHLAVRVANLGPETALGPTNVAIYGSEGDLLATAAITDEIDPGTASATAEVVVTRRDAENGVTVVAGDDGSGVSIDDCDTSNNQVTWSF